MKAACLLALAIGCAVLMPGAARADRADARSRPASSENSASPISGHPHDNAHQAASGTRKPQTAKKPMAKQPDHRVTHDKDQPRSGEGVNQATRPDRLPNSAEAALRGNSTDLRRSARSPAIAKTAPVQNEMASNALPVRPPAASSHAAAMRVAVPHRNPNPAVIGGVANSKAGSSGAISGTAMHRRP